MSEYSDLEEEAERDNTVIDNKSNNQHVPSLQ
jgi:hypothetical protein